MSGWTWLPSVFLFLPHKKLLAVPDKNYWPLTKVTFLVILD